MIENIPRYNPWKNHAFSFLKKQVVEKLGYAWICILIGYDSKLAYFSDLVIFRRRIKKDTLLILAAIPCKAPKIFPDPINIPFFINY